MPAALLLLGGLLLPESPRYLVNKGDTCNAFKVLTLIRKDVDQTQVQIELDEIKAVAAQDTKGGVRELFRIARPALVAAIGIMLFQQLVGINSVIYFLPQVFIKGFGFPEGDAIWVSVGIGVVNFVSTIVATLIMDRFPRKGVLIFGSIGLFARRVPLSSAQISLLRAAVGGLCRRILAGAVCRHAHLPDRAMERHHAAEREGLLLRAADVRHVRDRVAPEIGARPA